MRSFGMLAARFVIVLVVAFAAYMLLAVTTRPHDTSVTGRGGSISPASAAIQVDPNVELASCWQLQTHNVDDVSPDNATLLWCVDNAGAVIVPDGAGHPAFDVQCGEEYNETESPLATTQFCVGLYTPNRPREWLLPKVQRSVQIRLHADGTYEYNATTLGRFVKSTVLDRTARSDLLMVSVASPSLGATR